MDLSILLNIEVTVIEWIQKNILINSAMVELMSFFTLFGESKFIVLVFFYLYLSDDRKKAIKLGIKLVAVSLFNSMIKNIFLRRRPYFDYDNIVCLKPVEREYDIYDVYGQGYSFPSGHASGISSLVVSLYHFFYNKKFLHYGIVLIILVAFSRVSLGVHYPSDVLVGILVGILGTLIIEKIYERMDLRKIYLLLLIICSVGLLYCESDDFFSAYGILWGIVCADIFNDHFNNDFSTKNHLRIIIRFVGAIALFLLINGLFKLLLGDVSHFVGSIRYFIACFVVMGLFPLSFKYNIFKIEDDQ